jgi:hypothetical protein
MVMEVISKKKGFGNSLACGTLQLLWTLAASSTKTRNGDIGCYSNDWIAKKIGWPGKFGDSLVDALVETKWLDSNVVGWNNEVAKLYIHDWHVHCEDYVDKWLCANYIGYANGTITRRVKPDIEQGLLTFEEASEECRTHTGNSYRKKDKKRKASDLVRESQTSTDLVRESQTSTDEGRPPARAPALALALALADTNASPSHVEEERGSGLDRLAFKELSATGKFTDLKLDVVAQGLRFVAAHPEWDKYAIETIVELAIAAKGEEGGIRSAPRWMAQMLPFTLAKVSGENSGTQGLRYGKTEKRKTVGEMAPGTCPAVDGYKEMKMDGEG